MASPHAVDTLLRPPVELWSAAGASAVAQWAPWSLLMPPSMGSAASLMLAAFAAYRLQQGWRVVRYQRSMKRLPGFVMKAARCIGRHTIRIQAGNTKTLRYREGPIVPALRLWLKGSPWGSTSRA